MVSWLPRASKLPLSLLNVKISLCSLPCSPVNSVDNSEWMRNGDFIPSRLQAQQDAVNVVCRMKTRQNVENTIGLMTLAE